MGTQQLRVTYKVNDIFSNIIYVLVCFPPLLRDTCGLFPRFLFIIFVDIISIMVFSLYNKNNSYYFRNYILLIIMSIISALIIPLSLSTVFYSGRILFSIGALIGILLIYIYIVKYILYLKIIN